MTESQRQSWERFQSLYFEFPSAGLALDLSRMSFSEGFLNQMEAKFQQPFAEMRELEAGAIANPDEKRMVGHYWLRNPSLSPAPEIRRAIETTITAIEDFAGQVHSAKVKGAGGAFSDLLLVGIGGSALGPQFVSNALGHPRRDRLRIHFFDNTDPDGMQRVLEEIGSRLNQTLCMVISKSGGTKETRNGMLEARAAFEKAGLNFGSHAVAVTQEGSELDKLAVAQGWIDRFPMWDWVGGRTSQTSAVGLLPAALQGFAIRDLLAGAAACDAATREWSLRKNPAALLATAWFHATKGRGEKSMVVLPYKDRLELFAKYLQQLIMESLGKRTDRAGKEVLQGITVLGNKGATDQHSYIQQLRDGLDAYFAVFIEVLKDCDEKAIEVEQLTTSGDYLQGFYLGTRAALHGSGRESISITVESVSAFSVGGLIALFERAVGFYASLVNINAYHQPGVEAGKVAAGKIIGLQTELLGLLRKNEGKRFTIPELSSVIGSAGVPDELFKVCEHLAANPSKGIKRTRTESGVAYGYAPA
jgi:glucose-6-phosphate isomerase